MDFSINLSSQISGCGNYYFITIVDTEIWYLSEV